jgi:CheY-like chemotaxis protein
MHRFGIGLIFHGLISADWNIIMTIYDQGTLLVGREFLDSPVVTDWFLKRRRKCVVASTISEVGELSKSRNFDLVLSNYHLPDGTGFSLIDRFQHLPVSLFVSHPVEDGCIWLPGILRGVMCWGTAALQPRDFVRLLVDIISGGKEVYRTHEYSTEPSEQTIVACHHSPSF